MFYACISIIWFISCSFLASTALKGDVSHFSLLLIAESAVTQEILKITFLGLWQLFSGIN
jgi:hypothetical protein